MNKIDPDKRAIDAYELYMKMRKPCFEAHPVAAIDALLFLTVDFINMHSGSIEGWCQLIRDADKFQSLMKTKQ